MRTPGKEWTPHAWRVVLQCLPDGLPLFDSWVGLESEYGFPDLYEHSKEVLSFTVFTDLDEGITAAVTNPRAGTVALFPICKKKYYQFSDTRRD